MTVISDSEEKTSRFGAALGKLLTQPVIILLQGDLGAGKSVFARGLARGLGVSDDVPITSPTFTLMNHYAARLDLYHFDLYRLGHPDELIEIGFDDFAHNRGVALVEWPERLAGQDFDCLQLRIERITAQKRRLVLDAKGGAPLALLSQLEADWSRL